MPGRHQSAPVKRPSLRWLAALAGATVASAAGLAFFPSSAGAADDPVKATFSVTGVSTSNCAVSAGGSDVYVKPGQDLDVKSSVVGLTVLGAPIDLSAVAAFGGALTIDPGKSTAKKLAISGKSQTVSGLTGGDHTFTWDVTSVTLAGLLPIPLNTGNLTAGALAAGATLHYSGTIHVTADAAQCGVSVQIPGVEASASVTGLPPVKVSIPGVKVPTVPVSVPNVVGNQPSGGSTGSNAPSAPAGGHAGGGSSSGDSGDLLPVPARVVPRGDGNAVFGSVGGAYLPGVIPGANSNAGGTSDLVPVSAGRPKASPSPEITQQSTGKHKTIDLTAGRADSTGQFSVILAIVAVVALSVVAATYARLYLLRKDEPTA